MNYEKPIGDAKLEEVGNKPDPTPDLGWDCDLTCLFFDEKGVEGKIED